MPPQHVEIAETIAALRRKLRREKEASQTSAQPGQFATNRGNKLKSGARYVHAGSLPYSHVGGYKETINHAGYQRYILERKPQRYNGFGHEVDDSESDLDADADADEENAYGDVKIEDLLRPLTHPSELASHPALSHAYLDPALPEMVLATEAKLREERRNLWRAKNLSRYFTGDESWIPCERLETNDDWELFEPNPGWTGRLSSGESPGKRRKLDSMNSDIDGDIQIVDTIHDQYPPTAVDLVNGTLVNMLHTTRSLTEENQASEDQVEADIQDPDGPRILHSQPNGVHKNETITHSSPDKTGQLTDATEDVKLEDDEAQKNHAAEDGEVDTSTNADHQHNEDDRPSTASSPPLPTRRITRALAAEAETTSNAQIASPPPTSPTLSPTHSPASFEPHPTFLLPAHLASSHAIHPSHSPLTFSLAHSGLPPEELLETRKLLSLYIQKSEETIRGLEGILGKLIKAKRRRDRVLEWCVAEGHVGEMSDGEDWVDEKRWGLQVGELRKGRDEDGGQQVTENTTAGGAGPNPEGESEVVMGGRKGKRRRGAAKD